MRRALHYGVFLDVADLLPYRSATSSEDPNLRKPTKTGAETGSPDRGARGPGMTR